VPRPPRPRQNLRADLHYGYILGLQELAVNAMKRLSWDQNAFQRGRPIPGKPAAATLGIEIAYPARGMACRVFKGDKCRLLPSAITDDNWGEGKRGKPFFFGRVIVKANRPYFRGSARGNEGTAVAHDCNDEGNRALATRRTCL